MSRSLWLLVIIGCSSTAVRPGPTVGSGSAHVPFSLAGRYALQSQLDVSTGLPGSAGDLVRTLEDATDDPDDPARFLVDAIIAALPSGPIASAMAAAEPLVIGYVQDRIQTVAPQLVARMRALGAALARATRSFGLDEELDVPATGPALHTIRGVRIDGIALAFGAHGLPDATAANVAIAVDLYERVTIGSHQLAVPYGKLLRMAFDGAIVPSADPGATSFYDVLHDSIDCAELGVAIAGSLGIDEPTLFQAACTSGLVDVAHAFEAKLDALDASPLVFELAGTASATGAYGSVQTLAAGAWTGELSSAGSAAPIAAATFTGTRM